jgi:aminodeoxychorismate synthase component I
MSRPPTAAVAALASAHLLTEIDLDVPLDRCAAAFARAHAFLLDGAGGPPGLADHALFGAEPFLVFRAWRTPERRANGALACRVVITDEHGDRTTAHVSDPLAVLRALLDAHAVDPATLEGRPFPLLAGAVGYVGYEMGQALERLPCVPRPGALMPDMAFAFHRWILGRDRETGRTWLSVVGRGPTPRAAHEDAARTHAHVLAKLSPLTPAPRSSRSSPSASLSTPTSTPTSTSASASTSTSASASTPTPTPTPTPIPLSPSLPRDAYLARVLQAKSHIASGDAFEICLTDSIAAGASTDDPWPLFRALRAQNPAPFAAILDLPEGAIVSSSPERFLRVDAARVAESRPIKGTRPRGATPAEDDALARDLASSVKDRAENAMIVDLVRNDLGRVCRFGTVSVPELHAVERYATVHQLVSTVRGELDEGRHAVDAVRACFPPGSMTGAPKIEAMTILERLEPEERGPYAGALGYFDFTGTADLSVVIRTIVVAGGRARIHAGGAVVADSEPEAEHAEALQKARALVDALAAIA